MKTKINHFPNDGYRSFGFNWNGSAWDSSAITHKLYDSYGNDSSYAMWWWNSALMAFKLSSHDEYLNTYDGNGNLIIQERLSNYQIVNKDSLQPYTKKRFSNYLVCQSAASTAVNSNLESQRVSVYPNPSSEGFYVQLGDDWNEDAIVRLYSLQGQILYSKRVKRGIHFIQSSLSEGLYVLTVQNGDRSYHQRIQIR